MKRASRLVIALLAWGCDGSVGTDNCFGDDVLCTAPQDSRETEVDVAEFSTGDLPELTPTWIRELPTLPPEPSWGNMLLTSDFEGDVWYFNANEEGLVASTLDSEGAIIETRTVDSPRGWELQEGNPLLVFSWRQSPGGPAVQVTWPFRLESDEPNPGASIEWIKFGDRLERIPMDLNSPLAGFDLIWNEKGELFGSHGLGVFAKFDRKRELVWRQTSLRDQIDPLATTWFGLYDNGRVFVVLSLEGSNSSTVIDSRGNFEGDWSPLGSLVAARPRIPFPQQGPLGPVVITPTVEGDVYVQQMNVTVQPLGISTPRRMDMRIRS